MDDLRDLTILGGVHGRGLLCLWSIDTRRLRQ